MCLLVLNQVILPAMTLLVLSLRFPSKVEPKKRKRHHYLQSSPQPSCFIETKSNLLPSPALRVVLETKRLPLAKPTLLSLRTLVFEPGLGRAEEEKPPQCSCETISM